MNTLFEMAMPAGPNRPACVYRICDVGNVDDLAVLVDLSCGRDGAVKSLPVCSVLEARSPAPRLRILNGLGVSAVREVIELIDGWRGREGLTRV